jgi:hypothetical protein
VQDRSEGDGEAGSGEKEPVTPQERRGQILVIGNRLIDTDMGVASGGSITTLKYEERWTLDQLGNWTEHYLDLNGDGTITTANGDLNEDNPSTGALAHFNEVNEQLERDIDDDGTTDYTLVYNTLGQMTDDGEHYEYLYDGFGRLRKITNRVTDALVAEYRYNGLGHRIGVHEDFDVDGDVDANDPWHYYVYDEQWRSVSVYEDSESDPRETFVYHSAGQGGSGSSSYIDDVVRRKRDTDDNGSLDEMVFYCQNWRHDVVALIDASDNDPLEHLRSSPYGVPIGIPSGDIDQDGAVDTDDETYLAQKTPAYLVRADVVIDGLMTSADKTRVTGDLGTSLGYQTISNADNRKGLGGSELSGTLLASRPIRHVRNRYNHNSLGRWDRRDPESYIDGNNLYETVATNPIGRNDPYGLFIVSNPLRLTPDGDNPFVKPVTLPAGTQNWLLYNCGVLQAGPTFTVLSPLFWAVGPVVAARAGVPSWINPQGWLPLTGTACCPRKEPVGVPGAGRAVRGMIQAACAAGPAGPGAFVLGCPGGQTCNIQWHVPHVATCTPTVTLPKTWTCNSWVYGWVNCSRTYTFWQTLRINFTMGYGSCSGGWNPGGVDPALNPKSPGPSEKPESPSEPLLPF